MLDKKIVQDRNWNFRFFFRSILEKVQPSRWRQVVRPHAVKGLYRKGLPRLHTKPRCELSEFDASSVGLCARCIWIDEGLEKATAEEKFACHAPTQRSCCEIYAFRMSTGVGNIVARVGVGPIIALRRIPDRVGSNSSARMTVN